MLAIFALTGNALQLAERIKKEIPAAEIYRPGPSPGKEDNPLGHRSFSEGGFAACVAAVWPRCSQLVFIMAAGIVVRTIAPLLRGKKLDPAVVVLDEKGEFVISLLSGHWGGANDLARRIAACLNATPVITTATDVEGLPALDDLARKNGCILENGEDWKSIAMSLLEKKKTALYCTVEIEAVFPECVEKISSLEEIKESHRGLICITEHEPLWPDRPGIPGIPSVPGVSGPSISGVPDIPYVVLRPRNIIAGVGCRKGKSKEEICAALTQTLQASGISPHSLRSLATIDLKKEEKGLLEACADLGIPLLSFTACELQAVESRFKTSEFVKSRTGAGSVAEASAWLAASVPQLVAAKTCYSGITVALVKDLEIASKNCDRRKQ